ncbi:MAG: DUF1800 domain-containing protein [Ferruginibacter sp.]
MDRRDFLSLRKTAAPTIATVIAPAYTGGRVMSGLQPYNGPFTTTESLHLCRRLLFGAKKADVDFFKAMGMSNAVDFLLTVPATPPAPPLKTYNNSTTPGDLDVGVPAGTTWVNTNTNDGGINSNRRLSFKNWWAGLMVNQSSNILEKMVMFWHNHFSTETQTIGTGIWCYQNNACLRRNALGNFKTFAKEITLDTGMLRYLNGYLNTNTAPDENYARELQELFTVGKGVDNASPQYSEADVKAAAKVLTGWSVNNTTNSAQFNINRHDSTNKSFSSYYNNTIVTGRTGATAGDLELNDLLAMIFNNGDVALNICRKLYRNFVYYEIDAATEGNVIVPLANILRTNNYNIQPVLAALFKSEHFYDALNQGCIIKTPLEVIVGLCREYNVKFPDAADYVNNYFLWQFLQGTSTTLQQSIGDPPDVAGWPVYYQRPQFHEIWINSDTLPKRNQFTDLMAANGYTRNSKNIRIDHLAFAATLPNPRDPNALVADAIKYLLPIPLTTATMSQLKTDILLTGQANDGYWTGVWNTYIATPGNTTNTNLARTRLATLFQYLMRLSEYQLS